ncbi:class I adenylate-forming enzyme family protein [Devosia sp.]|uniref:class I adenylate-forming enzyme family protein n=1 Tax=Devosia sp. TaxID=1871048 RepID=UPI002EFC748E
MQLVKNIVYQCRRHEQEPAVAFGGGIATYAILMSATSAVAEVLQTLDLPKGSPVMLDIRNPVHHLATIYALALLGLPSASVGTAHVVEQTGVRPRLFLTDRDDLEAPGLPVRKVDDRWFAASTRQVDYQKLLSLPGFASPDEVVRYVYSSGTTGRAKCVALTGACMATRVANVNYSYPYRWRGDVTLNLMGFSTIAGILIPAMVHSAGSLLCFAGGYAEALQMIRLFKVEFVVAAVTQIEGVLKELGEQPPLASLRSIVLAGAKIPPRLLTDARAKLCSNVIGGYGSTEAGSLTSATATDLARHEGAIGYPLPWAQIEIVDDGGKPAAAGVDGTIRIRSDEQAVYADEQGRPAPTLDAGWFYPGDMGRLEPDGLLVITGRTGEVINRGGVIVAPDAIEEVLRLDPRVTDVGVVGVPNAAGIEEIWAGIVAADGLDLAAVAEAARPRLNEKVPDRLFRIEAVPRNDNGKVMRNVLREVLRACRQQPT